MNKTITASDILYSIWKENVIDSFVICPNCLEIVHVSEFIESEVYCETFGSHCSVKCPRCDENFDTAYDIDNFIIV